MSRPSRLLLLLLLLTTPAAADIVDVSPSGFLMKHEVSVGVPSDKAYGAFVGNVSSWWNAQHSYSGDASNFSIEPKALGCFCERLANGGSIAHMQVVYVQPNSTIRMIGGLGPLQASGVTGSLTMRFIAAPAGASGSKIEMTYSVGGKQYVAVPSGWGGWIEGYAPELYGAQRGSALFVFALP